MKKVIYCLCLSILLFLISYCSLAQNQYNVWYFGYDTNFTRPTAGLDFNSGSPVALLNSKMTFTEGCATYCNSSGQLLFYTNGDSVWDATHHAMPNGGVNLPGQFTQSSMQNSLIIPVYGDPKTYYLFLNAGIPTAGNTGIFYYTKIDMNLNAGLGDVSTPLTTLLNGTSERITGVKHCNGRDHWVVTHLSGTNTFYSMRVTKCGVSDTVISSVGPVEASGNLWSSLKASPKGDKLSTVIYDSNGDAITCIYNFDNLTGRVTGCTPIDTATNGMVSIANMFSPDGNLFYLSSSAYLPMEIYQFNLNAGNISNSKTQIGVNSTSADSIEAAYDFQIGRDGKLYVGVSDDLMNLNTLDVINNPNTIGMGCGYTNGGVSLGNRSCWLNLPNHITDYLNPLPVKPFSAGFTFTNSCINTPVAFTDTSSACYIKTRTWNFGDPSSGINNISSLQHPVHTYNNPGTYTVTLIISDGCERDTIAHAVNIALSPTLNTTPAVSICPGSGALLTAGGATSYSWFPSTGLSSSTGASVNVNATSNTTYTVIGYSGTCFSSATVNVTIGSPTLTITGNTTMCKGDSTTLTINGANSYSWAAASGLTTSTGQAVTVKPNSTTTYTVIGTSAGGCTAIKTVTVTVSNTPLANAGNDTTICEGSAVTLKAAGGSSYLWSNGSSLATVTVTPPTTSIYAVIVSNGVCKNTDNVTITVLPKPIANAGNSASITSGSSASLLAKGGAGYQWTPTIGLSCIYCPNPVASPEKTTVYYVIVTDENGCTDTDSLTVEIICNNFFIPNAFSPNGDGENDIFMIYDNCIAEFTLSIYNRWGEKVFVSNSPEHGWDGSFRGKDEDSGVFYYQLIGKMYNGNEITKEGNITLLR